jgi:hypothetical protein
VIVSRKKDPRGVLRNLPVDTQAAIIDYMDGRNGQEPHAAQATANWLESQGTTTTQQRLSDFRKWRLNRENLQEAESACMELLQSCREKGWLKTAEEEREMGQLLFNRLAISRQDATMWSEMQRVQATNDKAHVDKKKIELEEGKYNDERADAKKGKKAATQPALSPEERQRRIRQILGTE